MLNTKHDSKLVQLKTGQLWVLVSVSIKMTKCINWGTAFKHWTQQYGWCS